MLKKEKVKKKAIVAGMTLLVFSAVIGVTMAVNHDKAVFNNTFGINNYKTVFTEDFASPSNWRTCETIDKTITVTNEASVPIVARIKLDEQWLDKDKQELPLVSEASGLTMAIINFAENSGWERRGEYYYYENDIAPGETTTSVITGVTLNCEANLALSGIVNSNDRAYGGSEYHLIFTAQTLQADSKKNWDDKISSIVEVQSNPRDFHIDFTNKAIASEDIFIANGNGVQKYTENGEDIYYYRGEIDNNYLIWADQCWRILRTTYTGGTKLIYSGKPSSDKVRQCNATGADVEINNTVYRYAISSWALADVGYQYGDRVEVKWGSPIAAGYTFANDVTRNGSTYTLDTSVGQSVTGTWAEQRTTAAERYHYFCTDGATSCSSSKIAYLFDYTSEDTIYYFLLGGYNDIEHLKEASFTNRNNSLVKTAIESWFEKSGLSEHEDDLEDAVYCNDRTIVTGALKGKDSPSPTVPSFVSGVFYQAQHSKYDKYESGNLHPLLECSNTRDSFTKSTANGNGRLAHKVGLITGSELVLAGFGSEEITTSLNNYLYSGRVTWTMSPYGYSSNALVMNFATWPFISARGTWDQHGLRPVVTLKAGMKVVSGNGTKTNPYIVK
ncbi:MAG: hypothetical protein MJ154_00490 [Candidatus Saccharibacteria bacterium]|nr:hypothetical protein [Candidatus Saccharibacteria bacterium]